MFADLAAEIDQRALPYELRLYINQSNELIEDVVQNRESFVYDWMKSLQLQTSRSMRVRISACFELGLMDFKVSSWLVKSNASCMLLTRDRTLSSR